jgi:hypothetical protein
MLPALIFLIILVVVVLIIFYAVDIFAGAIDSRLAKIIKLVVGAIALILMLQKFLPLLTGGRLF